MVDFDNVASLNAPWNFLVLEVLDKDGKYIGTKVVFDLPSGTMESETGGENLNVQSRLLDEKFSAVLAVTCRQILVLSHMKQILASCCLPKISRPVRTIIAYRL